MSGSALAQGSRTARLAGSVGVLVRIEVLKLLKRRIFWVAVVLFALLATMKFAIASVAAGEEMAFLLVPPGSWPATLAIPAAVGPAFLGLVVIALVAPEFTWRTARQSVIDGLGVERFYAAKCMTVLALSALSVTLALVLGFIGAAVGPVEWESNGLGAGDVQFLASYTAASLMAGAAALWLACTLRAGASAMVAFIGYAVAEPIAAAILVGRSDVLDTVLSYLPVELAMALANRMAHYPEALPGVLEMAEVVGMSPPGAAPVKGLLIAVHLYAVVLFAAGYATMRYRDL